MDVAQMKRYLTALLLLTACTGADRSANAPGGGTLVISTAGDPDALFPPFVGTVQGRQVTDLVYDRLASLGDSLNTIGDAGFIPGLAKSWTWSPDSLRITFHLDPAARWHDGAPVTSSDVRFTLAAYRDSIVASDAVPIIASIDSISTPDSATAVFWFHAKSPEQFYEATDNMSILPEHIWKKIPVAGWRSSEQARHPIGSGQFRFASRKQGESLTIVADTGNYRGRPKLDRVVWSIAPDFNTALARFLSGQTDFFEAVRADIIPQIARNPSLKILTSPGVQYSFLQFNLKDSLFANRELRRALTMAVDRKQIVRSVYDSLAQPALAGSIRAYPTTDTTITEIPFDTAAAARTLDSLGWREFHGRAPRSKSGHPLFRHSGAELEQGPHADGGPHSGAAAQGRRWSFHRPAGVPDIYRPHPKARLRSGDQFHQLRSKSERRASGLGNDGHQDRQQHRVIQQSCVRRCG
jgi:ABC-type dipeptide transport system, periplasmic component